MTRGPGPFPREFFQFLAELKFNNDRAWFISQKARYEATVKEPFRAFVEALLPAVTRIHRDYTRAKIFRIQRDTRFSKDKSPYKAHAAAQFRHRSASSDVHAPGFYLHLEPGQCFAAAGIWRPEPAVLAALRARIARRDPAWRAVHKAGLVLSEEESLKRIPKGFPPDHPEASDLKRRNFITWVDFSDRDAGTPGFDAKILAAYRASLPLIKVLNLSMGF